MRTPASSLAWNRNLFICADRSLSSSCLWHLCTLALGTYQYFNIHFAGTPAVSTVLTALLLTQCCWNNTSLTRSCDLSATYRTTFYSISNTQTICILCGNSHPQNWACFKNTGSQRLCWNRIQVPPLCFSNFAYPLGLCLMFSKSFEVTGLTPDELLRHTAESSSLGSFKNRRGNCLC